MLLSNIEKVFNNRNLLGIIFSHPQPFSFGEDLKGQILHRVQNDVLFLIVNFQFSISSSPHYLISLSLSKFKL